MTSRSVVIAEPVRTAIGAFGGTLKDMPAPDLGAIAIRAAVERAGLSTLNEGQKVSFDIVADRRSGKSSADNLRAG